MSKRVKLDPIQSTWNKALQTNSLEIVQKLFHLVERSVIISSFATSINTNPLFDWKLIDFISTQLPLLNGQTSENNRILESILLKILFSDLPASNELFNKLFIHSVNSDHSYLFEMVIKCSKPIFVIEFFDILIQARGLKTFPDYWLTDSINHNAKLDTLKHIITIRKINVNKINSKKELPLRQAAGSIIITRFLVEECKADVNFLTIDQKIVAEVLLLKMSNCDICKDKKYALCWYHLPIKNVAVYLMEHGSKPSKEMRKFYNTFVREKRLK